MNANPLPLSPYAYNPIVEEFAPPEQFHPARDTSREKRLLLAVLEEALTCLYFHIPPGNGKRKRAAQTLRDDARAWIESNDMRWLFSFRHICEVLGYDAEKLRAAVLRDGFRLHKRGTRVGTTSGRTMLVGTKDHLEDLDRAERRRRKRVR